GWDSRGPFTLDGPGLAPNLEWDAEETASYQTSNVQTESHTERLPARCDDRRGHRQFCRRSVVLESGREISLAGRGGHRDTGGEIASIWQALVLRRNESGHHRLLCGRRPEHHRATFG